MDQVIMFVLVVIVYEIFEVVFAAWSTVAIVLHIRLVVFTAELEGGLARFDLLLTDEIAPCVLFLNFLFALRFVLFTYDALMRRIIQ